MPPSQSEKLQYPIGRFSFSPAFTAEELERHIHAIRVLPAQLMAAMKDMEPQHFDTVYRPGGWTVRQVVHHIADSHLNAFVRFKLALTEIQPTIKPYLEEAWAELPDSQRVDPRVSVQLIESLHHRWTVLLEGMNPSDFQKTLFHPERGRSITLWEMLALYAWHGAHHIGHIRLAGENI
jgi:uncharacterized damage-inducible protein DinB